jgi:hypothetical protein
MATCIHCAGSKGKRACPALGGEICPTCCGKHRLVAIACPDDCRWLGNLSIVRAPSARAFAREDYHAAMDKLIVYTRSAAELPQMQAALGRHIFPPRADRHAPEWMVATLTTFLACGARADADGQRAIDRFITAYARRLPAGEVAALVAMQRAWASLFEIDDVQLGAGLTLRDLLAAPDAPTVHVREVSATKQVRRGDRIFGWIMDAGDHLELGGAPMFVPRVHSEGVRAALLAAIAGARQDRRDASVRELAGAFADVAIAHLRDALGGRRRPTLVTSDGDESLACEAHYELRDRAAAVAALDTIEDVHDEPADPSAYVWIDPASSTVLGMIRLSRDGLRLETFSRPRLERGRALLEARLGASIAHRADAFADLVSSAARPDEMSAGAPDPAELDAMRDVLRDHYTRWLDDKLPALGGKSPRAAMKTKKGRGQVAALLDDFEHEGAGDPELWDDLRDELGLPVRTARAALTYDAAIAPAPDAWLAADEADRLDAIEAHHDGLTAHPDLRKPALHATAHLTVENQIAAGDPEETAATVARLVARGASRHDAIHQVMRVILEEMDAMVRESRQFDRDGVARTLARL